MACGERFECNCASVLAGWSGSARTPPANEDSKRREVARLSISAFYRRATSPRYHPTGQCRHDCQHLAGLRPDHAPPWPALPCHDVTIALDDPIATLGRASPRRRVAFFSNGSTLASLHLNVLLGRLVAGLGGASPRVCLVLAIGGAWWSFDYLPRLRPGWLVGLRPDPAPASEDSVARDIARPSISAFYRRATSPRRHLAGRCRHDCQYLAWLRPDRAPPWPALPRHNVTIALDELIATLGRASRRRRLPTLQWRSVSIPPSRRLTWSPRGRARWGFAPTSPGFWTGWGFAPPPLRRR